MRNPLVTVCIVTFNQRAYIERSILSVVEQVAAADLRILVGDDASDDGTSDIVAQLAAAHHPQIRHLRHQPRLGSFANMRKLMSLAEGDFVAHLDGDDYWLPGKLERQLAYLQSHPDCAAVYTNAITVDEDGRPIGLFNDVGDWRFDLAALLRRGNFLNNSSVLFPISGRHAWSSAHEPQIDYRANLWHARHGCLAQIGTPLAAYRVNTRGSIVAVMNDHVRELYWQAIQSVPRDRVTDGDYARGLGDFLRRVFFRALNTRNESLALRWWPRVLAASPYGAWRTNALVLASILRIAKKTAMGLVQRGEDGRRLRVLYRR